MELLDIADEYGNLTGEVMEREKAHDLNKLHWKVSIFIINKKKYSSLARTYILLRPPPSRGHTAKVCFSLQS